MTTIIVISLLLMLGSAFFVAAEYSLVSSRKSRFEALARQGNKGAAVIAKEIERLGHYVAGIQIAITMLGIGVGAVTEPYVTHVFEKLMPGFSRPVSYGLGFLSVSFILVVVGELVPKYATLKNPEKTALMLFPPLRLINTVFRPLIWVAQKVSSWILQLFGVRMEETNPDTMLKDELLLLVQTGGTQGVLEKRHAELVSRALRLDVLAASDIMVHRLDVHWLDVQATREQVFEFLSHTPHSRIPVCRGDIDDLVGIVHLHELFLAIDEPEFDVEKIVHPPVMVPENLSLERLLQTMRLQRVQILVVADEYGGTSGIVTFEDLAEEVFGDLEEQEEGERPAMTLYRSGRLVARADVRYDEVVHFLELPIDPGDKTESLATMLVDALEKVPSLGDRAETELGVLRVDQMLRQRIVWVSIQLKPEILADVPSSIFFEPKRR